MPLPTTVTPSDSLRAFALGPETLTSGTGVSAGLATYMEMLPVKSYKNDLQDTRLVTQEIIATLVRDTSTTRLYKHNDVTYAAYSRFDKSGWLLRNAIGTPVTVAVGSTSTNNIQTLAFASTGTGSWLSTETFTLGIGGYVSSPIAWASTAATLLTNMTAALNAMPSVVSFASTGTRNLSYSPGTFTASTCTINISASNNLAHVNLPTFIGSTNSALGTLTITNATPGVGSFQHTFTVGASGKLPNTYGEFDGVSFKLNQSGAIDSLDLAATMTDAPVWSVKAISQAEVDYSTMAMMSTASFVSVFPNYFFSQYTNTMDPTQLTFNIGGTLASNVISGGSTNSTVLDLKLSGKNNRKTMNAMGGASGDMIRATEGIVSWAGTCKLRYATTYTASQYANYVTNSAPGQFILQWQDAATFIGAAAGAANHPTMNIVIPNPKWEKGARLADTTAEPELDMGFRALYDQGTQTSMTIVLVNETPRYTTLT